MTGGSQFGDLALWGATLIALGLTIAIAIRSGRKRRRLSGTTFYVVCLVLCALFAGVGLLADDWFTWKAQDDFIANIVSNADPNSITVTNNRDYVQYKIENPRPGVLSTSWNRYPYEFPEMLVGSAILFGALIALVPLIVRGLIVRRMGARLREGHCNGCGYDLTANQSGICPECGKAAVATA